MVGRRTRARRLKLGMRWREEGREWLGMTSGRAVPPPDANLHGGGAAEKSRALQKNSHAVRGLRSRVERTNFSGDLALYFTGPRGTKGAANTFCKNTA